MNDLEELLTFLKKMIEKAQNESMWGTVSLEFRDGIMTTRKLEPHEVTYYGGGVYIDHANDDELSFF